MTEFSTGLDATRCDPSRLQSGRVVHGHIDLGGVILLWAARMVPEKECEGGGWYSRSATKRVLAFRYGAKHRGYTAEILERNLPDCEWASHASPSIEQALEDAEADTRKRFSRLIAQPLSSERAA